MFITFEGGEGSGKSYQARALYGRLLRRYSAAVLVREPGTTPLGKRLGRLLKRGKSVRISPLSELLLFNAARAQLVADVIQPALKENKIVVCDRFTDSTLAYQGYARDLDIDLVTRVNDLATGGMKPDVTILLDMPVRLGMARVDQQYFPFIVSNPPARDGLARKRGSSRDRFESEDVAFHERVRQGYLSMAEAEPHRFVVIDARQDRRRIASMVWNLVGDRLLQRRFFG